MAGTPGTEISGPEAVEVDCDEILARLKSLADPKAVEGMARFGITPEHAYGVSLPQLRKIAAEAGRSHHLARRLWAANIRETRILATMIDDPAMVTEEQMKAWVTDFDYWEICDQCCMNLFKKTRYAYQKCLEWSSREEEYVKRAGFVLMACLAVSDKKAGDAEFERFFPIIRGEAHDDRNSVRKAVSWALRQIGKRNLSLNQKAIEVAKELQGMGSRSARWIASDAIRELSGAKVQNRLQNRKR